MEHRETTKMFHLMCHQMPFWCGIKCKTFLDDYGSSGFKKALLQNPQEMIRGRIFSEMIRIQARKSELRAESQSYGPKVGVTAGRAPRLRTESPRKGPRMGFRCFYREPPLKPSWILRKKGQTLKKARNSWEGKNLKKQGNPPKSKTRRSGTTPLHSQLLANVLVNIHFPERPGIEEIW